MRSKLSFCWNTIFILSVLLSAGRQTLGSLYLKALYSFSRRWYFGHHFRFWPKLRFLVGWTRMVREEVAWWVRSQLAVSFGRLRVPPWYLGWCSTPLPLPLPLYLLGTLLGALPLYLRPLLCNPFNSRFQISSSIPLVNLVHRFYSRSPNQICQIRAAQISHCVFPRSSTQIYEWLMKCLAVIAGFRIDKFSNPFPFNSLTKKVDS